MEIKKLEAAIEAILFTMGESVELSQIADAIQQDKETTRKIIQNMMDKYQKKDRGIQIIELEQSYQLCSKKEYYECLIRLAMHPKKPALTDVMLETLSIIAYKQPVTKAEIEKIRGVKCDHAINKLVEYELVRELGRLDAPGRPILFGTTEEFLRCFGVQGLEELPSVDPVRLEDFKAEAEEEHDESESDTGIEDEQVDLEGLGHQDPRYGSRPAGAGRSDDDPFVTFGRLGAQGGEGALDQAQADGQGALRGGAAAAAAGARRAAGVDQGRGQAPRRHLRGP